jgi:hypothetical protein
LRLVTWVGIALLAVTVGTGWAGSESSKAYHQAPTGTHGPQDVARGGDNLAPAEKGGEKRILTEEEAAKEQRLRERVQQRWDAVVKRDFEKAFEFETPEYRKGHTAEDYGRQFGTMVQWHMARVKDIGYHSPDEAEVVVALDFSFPLPAGEDAKTTIDAREKWVFLEGDWWRRHVKSPLGGAKQSEPSPHE